MYWDPLYLTQSEKMFPFTVNAQGRLYHALPLEHVHFDVEFRILGAIAMSQSNLVSDGHMIFIGNTADSYGGGEVTGVSMAPSDAVDAASRCAYSSSLSGALEGTWL